MLYLELGDRQTRGAPSNAPAARLGLHAASKEQGPVNGCAVLEIATSDDLHLRYD